MEKLLPLLVALPLLSAFLMPLIPKKARGLGDILGIATMLCTLAISILCIGKNMLYHIGGWPSPLGIDLRLDGLSALIILTVNVIGFIAMIYSVPYMKLYTQKFRFLGLYLLLIAGLNGVALSGDLFNMYIFMELATISSYALVGFGCGHEELEASFKYLVLGSLSSAFILLALAIVYACTGTLNMAYLAAWLSSEKSILALFALVLFICGFGLKAAFVPFHAWLPDAHSSAPAPISAMLSGVVIKTAGMYAFLRIAFNIFGITDDLLFVLKWLGAASMLVGVLMALGQWDMKRLFAYHTISQVGYIALGLGLGTPLGIIGGLYHLVNHSVFKSLLFLTAGSVEYSTGIRDLKKLGGLNKAMPLTGLASLTGSLSISGIPPLNGFWSKLIIIIACVVSGNYIVAGLAVFVSLLTLASFLKVQKYGFFESLKISAEHIKSTPILMGTAMVLLMLLCAGMAMLVIPGFSSAWLVSDAAGALLNGIFRM